MDHLEKDYARLQVIRNTQPRFDHRPPLIQLLSFPYLVFKKPTKQNKKEMINRCTLLKTFSYTVSRLFKINEPFHLLLVLIILIITSA